MRPPNQPNRERGGERTEAKGERERAVRQGCGHQINRQGRREERRIEEKKREKGREERRREERESRHHPINTRERDRNHSAQTRKRDEAIQSSLSLAFVGRLLPWVVSHTPPLSVSLSLQAHSIPEDLPLNVGPSMFQMLPPWMGEPLPFKGIQETSLSVHRESNEKYTSFYYVCVYIYTQP